ncbi:hypothetical protein [Spartinivicinus ruber]|uniref:hypothetical protein n=1 Tax=Spartinivicinus ruber TaxID=2683272 RepID=UPI0013CF6952|nr:hypothetical protein [Spartinivicinus ruber]
MYIKKLTLLICMLLCSANALAKYSQDTGKIKEVYVSYGGAIAILLDRPFANAISTNQCPSSNAYAGNTSADPALKSAILTAKSSGQTVRVTIEGCDSGWFKIIDIYLL